MEQTIFSLLPPFIIVVMVIFTKRVLLSLGTGIVIAALFLANFSVGNTFSILWSTFKGVFVLEGTLNTWNIFILLFIIFLGIVTAFINVLGGTKAFGDWAMKRVKTRAGAQVMTAIFGLVIFIDDYFNSLAVGQIARPITDRHRVSRTKLSYIIDSTSAPVCVVSPISSWGAYIIGIIGTILTLHQVTEYSALLAFIKMIPMNLYVWSTLGLVFLVALRGIDFGPMKTHEVRAIETGEVTDPHQPVSGDFTRPLPSSEHGEVSDLILPILSLIIATVAAMMWTGVSVIDEKVTLLKIFENTDVAKSLVYGGLGGLFMTFLLFIRKRFIKKQLAPRLFLVGVRAGVKSMIPACLILIFAWGIVSLIDQLKTGTYLAGIVEKSNLDISFLPFLLFIVAGVIAFATGTSWGSFGILLPIAGEIAAVSDIDLLLPAMAAVLAGAVFGDHCSPISDTTILSSTGAACHHIDHVITQLPYALVAAGISAIGYIILGLTGSALAGLATVIVCLFLMAMKRKNKTVEVK
ncbi:Na+/H+ antiporter NhaC [Oikeobacillus pervagus]|uniref:Na+/H+ antiporter NhaC n=1 Tax=Oikeobacillus pervagus TaxID=1325931 RepID=A0AAJ1T2J5_9BACI|nr:Na+/H+ antiporter NhaC family protein [Oikeobacillus pervagus]MDQ0215516.1 Na+/H+ antiporter NhaC [Oikeobacillus pervagus]